MGKTISVIRIHPSAGEHGHENVEDVLAIGDGKDVRRVRAGERRLAHVVHLLVGDAVAGQIRAVHGRLHIQRAVLHVEHERHDLRIVCFGQSQSMHSGVVVEITEILQQIERELLARQSAFAQFADERLPVAFLPYEVGGFAQPLREWGKIGSRDALRSVERGIGIGYGNHISHMAMPPYAGVNHQVQRVRTSTPISIRHTDSPAYAVHYGKQVRAVQGSVHICRGLCPCSAPYRTWPMCG